MPETLIRFIKNKLHLSLFLLAVIYLVGIVTALLGHTDALMQLTPYNLVFATGLILYNAEGMNKVYLKWFLLIAVAGYLIELLGIITGIIFGIYAYGEGLGIKLFDVPLIIGINWAVLVFSTAAILNKLKLSIWLKAAIAASMMVAYDILLEPVAIRFDFWNWEGGSIPLQNYIAWWLIAYVMLLGVLRYVKNLQNKIALYVVLVQSLFFAILILKEGLKVF
ncbi:MAG: carotenoid biosynthesis protein [Bacteroidetes bacterium]|jgi:bisanhydrobacterioruberin hydratase|nr:carotenoid biosynthesis protein [Bacteroidota bacterium]